MCKVMSKVCCKIFGTVLLTIVFGMGVWICFDVYTTSDNFIYSAYQNANKVPVPASSLTLIDATVKSSLFQIPLQKGHYNNFDGFRCYFEDAPTIAGSVYYKTDKKNPEVFVEGVEEGQNVEKKTQIECIQADLLDKKGFYFEGLNTTVFWVGICGCVIYLVCLLCVWICCWKNKKGPDYVSTNVY